MSTSENKNMGIKMSMKETKMLMKNVEMRMLTTSQVGSVLGFLGVFCAPLARFLRATRSMGINLPRQVVGV